MSLIERGEGLPPLSDAVNAYDLLADVATVLEAEPKRLEMSIVYVRGEGISRWLEFHPEHTEPIPTCNTVGCIAGWSLVLAGESFDNGVNYGLTEEASYMLGLDSYLGQRLFYPFALFNDDSEPGWERLNKPPHMSQQEYVDRTVHHLREFMQQYEAKLRATPLSRSR